jgi:L-fucose isomerase-like protein
MKRFIKSGIRRVFLMKDKARIGVVCLARKTFDYQAADEIYKDIMKSLPARDDVEFVFVYDLLIETSDAKAAAKKLAENSVNGLICISGTFHLGHLILEIDKVLNKPIMLWALPELPYDGGKIRLNSICGLNLNASNLYKSGVRNYHAQIGPDIDQDWVTAVKILNTMREAHIGLVGSRAHGFFNLDVYDLSFFREFGTLIDNYSLAELIGTEVTPQEILDKHQQLKARFNLSGISMDQADRVAGLAAKFESFMDLNSLDAIALRCWPEFAEAFGISPCASMSLVQASNKIIACEGDIEGAVSMIAQKAAGAEAPYLFDFSQVSLEEDHALLWHCGVAPCSLWDGVSDCTLDTYFAGGRGVTAGFVLKPGDVSILRFDSAPGEQRVFLKKATGLPMGKELSGTYLKARFDEPVKEVLEKVVANGIAHHASMSYGDFIRPFEILAKIKSWRIIS